MKKINKKGFTLVELLAVIIVLVIISILAINKISSVMKKNNENTVIANASTFIKAVEENAGMTRITGNFKDGIHTVSDIFDMGLKISGTKPKSGKLFLNEGKVIISCLIYDKFTYKYKNGNQTVDKSNNCDNFISFIYDFNLTGETKEFITPYSATYKLEVWGAQGGSSKSQEVAHGGYGGYSVGTIHLNKDDKLYVTVGGKGVDGDNTSTTKTGGFNGGGNKVTPDSAYYGSSGGGATHIATKTGVLSSLSSSTSNIIIVAGGGGGGAGTGNNYGAGGSGGGYAGMRGGNNYGNVGWGNGGTQTQAGCKNTSSSYCGSFGQGNGTSNGHGGAGGGGFYGGGATNSDNIGGGGGGSGYIQTSILTDASMYCYNCTESSDMSTKTVSTTCYSSTPTENCAKQNDGHARITLLDLD